MTRAKKKQSKFDRELLEAAKWAVDNLPRFLAEKEDLKKKGLWLPAFDQAENPEVRALPPSLSLEQILALPRTGGADE